MRAEASAVRTGERYRWAVLAAGTAAQASVSAVGIGLPVLAPAAREFYGVSLTATGLLLASVWIGTAVTLLPAGLLADRLGERFVLALGLGLCAVLLAAAALTPRFSLLVLLLAFAGAAGASVNSASGRAVMHWFRPEERGFALGVRQTAIPAGGLVAAVLLPPVVDAGGLGAGFLLFAGLCLAGAVAGGIVIRERVSGDVDLPTSPWTLRDARLWRLCIGSGLYLVAQVALLGFVVLFLHEEHGLSTGAAAAVLAAVQVFAAALRIAAGRWSDTLGTRIVPLRRIGVATVVALGISAALAHAPAAVLVPALIAAGSLSMAWNGLSFTAAAELGGRARSGAAIGVQQTVLALVGVAAPVAFAATVSATSWQAAFAFAALGPLAGWWALRRLSL